MIKLVVFDWNGTLFDDIPLLIEGMNKGGLALLGRPPIDLATYQEHFETPLKTFYERLGVPGDEFDRYSSEIGQAFERNYEPLALHAQSRPRAKETLMQLREYGATNTILSNHTTEGIYLQLSRLGLEEYIETVLANDYMSVVHHAGKEERLRKYLEDRGFASSEVVIIGDSLEEVRIARNLALRCIAITGGACTPNRMKTAKPDYTIEDLGEIYKIVRELA